MLSLTLLSGACVQAGQFSSYALSELPESARRGGRALLASRTACAEVRGAVNAWRSEQGSVLCRRQWEPEHADHEIPGATGNHRRG